MKRFRLSQTYLRMFLFLSILFTVAFVPYTLFLSTKFSSYAQNEIDSNTSAKLDQMLKSTEFALDRLKSYGLSMYETPLIREWLASDQKNPLLVQRTMNAMTILLANEPFIHTIYLMNTNTQEIIDSNVGIRSEAEFADQRMLEIIRNERPKVLRYFIHEIAGSKHLALVVPSTPINNAYNGYLVMLLDNEALRKTLLQFSESSGIEVAIADEHGDAVVASPEARELLPYAVQAEANGRSGSVQLNSEEWSVYKQLMGSQPWTMYYITRTGEAKQQIVSLQRHILLASLLLLALLNLLLYWISRRSYRPFSQLAARLRMELDSKRFKQAPDFSGNPADYKVIQHSMDALIDTVDNMVFSLRTHQEVIDSEYLQRWIMVGAMNEPVRDYIEARFRLLSYSQLRMLVLRVDHYAAFVERYDQFGSRKLIKYGMSNIAKEILTANGWAAESVDFGGDHIVILLGHDDVGEEELLAAIDRIVEQTELWLSVQVVIGLSEPGEASCDLRGLYEHTYEMTHLKFITGKGHVFREQDMRRYMGIVKPSGDEQHMEGMIQNVRLGELDKALANLEAMMRHLQTLPRSACLFELTIVLHGLMKAFKPFDLIDTPMGIQPFLERFRTLDEVQAWLRGRLEDIVQQLGNRKNGSRKEALAAEIRDYVKSRLHDAMLSVEDVGNHLQLSASYVRQVFKEVVGMTLSDYILEARIEQVKKLLETTDWPIADIAEHSGFQTKSHFYTTFKRMTGRTPNEHRQYQGRGKIRVTMNAGED